MATLRTRNGALLLKQESVPGTYEAPDPATDGILVEAPTINPTTQNVETDEVQGSLDSTAPIVGGMQVTISGAFYLKGPGVPGEYPEWDLLMRIAGMAATQTRTDITGVTFSVTGASAEIADSGDGLAALTVGTVIHVSGFANEANNGEFIVTTSAAGAIVVARLTGATAMVDEAAGENVTLRRGIAAVEATAGAADSITLQAPWANTAQLYRGMPVALSGNPATVYISQILDYTAGRVAVLADNFSTPLSDSTVASIPANIRYAPASSSIPAASVALYMDGVVYRCTGAKATLSIEQTAGGAARCTYTISALMHEKDDAAVPSVTYDGTRPGIWRNSAMLVNKRRAALQTLSVDLGNEVIFPPDPNGQEGFDAPIITRRRMTGSMDPNATLVATRDLMTAFRDGTAQPVAARLAGGSASRPGQRVGLAIPSALYTSYQPGDRQGVQTEQTGFFLQGQDSGLFLQVW